MSLFKILIATLLAYLLADAALLYGGIWQSMAHPTQNVTVTLERQSRPITGALSRDWDGQMVLQSEDTTVVRFPHDAVSLMTFAGPHRAFTASEMLANGWRASLPFLLVMWVYLTWLVNHAYKLWRGTPTAVPPMQRGRG